MGTKLSVLYLLSKFWPCNTLMLNQEGAQVRREFVHQLFVKILVCQKIDVDFEPGRSTGMERTCSRAGVMDRNPSLERWPLTIGLYQKKV